MYFEGSEKKFEVIARAARFRQRPDSYWHSLVETAGAKVLSKISNEACDAYLLSESSLFVWEDRVTMITCGTTTLARAADRLLEDFKDVEFVSFQRKNELFPHLQDSDFQKDIQVLKRHFDGKAYRFGSPDEHHLFLYHMDKPFRPQGVDTTLEILMYNLQGQPSEIFHCGQTIERVRHLTRMDTIFPDFQVDDYLFSPCGYSLNAIKGNEYYTIHVTPEETGSYVSFETNVRLGNRLSTVLRQVTQVFQPRSFDVIYFHPEKELKAIDMSPFIQLNYVRQSLNCGYEVGFSTYTQKVSEPQAAIQLDTNL